MSKNLKDTKIKRDKFIRSFIRPIKKKLKSSIRFKVIGRPKSIFSFIINEKTE